MKNTNDNEQVKNEILEVNKTQVEEKNDDKKQPKKKNKVFQIISKIISGILWIAVICSLVILIMIATSKRTSIFGFRLYLIMSGSMEPTIHVRDAIITKEIDEPKVNDVIAFQNGNAITVHRIIKEYTEGDKTLYQTKGDNNNSIDPGLVQKSQIKGKFLCNISWLGKTILYLQSNMFILVIAIGGIIILSLAKILIGRLM